MTEELFRSAADHATAFLASLDERPVVAAGSGEQMRAAFDAPLPETGMDDLEVIRDLAERVDPGLTAMQSGRFFGFVIGGAHPPAVAADWLTSTWDQNAGLHVPTPGAAVVEDVTIGWLRELLALPAHVSCGLVTGCQMAHVTCL